MPAAVTTGPICTVSGHRTGLRRSIRSRQIMTGCRNHPGILSHLMLPICIGKIPAAGFTGPVCTVPGYRTGFRSRLRLCQRTEVMRTVKPGDGYIGSFRFIIALILSVIKCSYGQRATNFKFFILVRLSPFPACITQIYVRDLRRGITHFFRCCRLIRCHRRLFNFKCACMCSRVLANTGNYHIINTRIDDRSHNLLTLQIRHLIIRILC